MPLVLKPEECKCGHLRSQHNDRIVGNNPVPSKNLTILGAADCRICGCEKYTWARFVKMDGF